MSAPSFFQGAIEKNSRLSTGADLANFEAVQFVRNLARQQNDDALTEYSPGATCGCVLPC